MITPNDLGILVPKWREGQWEAVQNSRDSKHRFVVHSMPPGGGKSIVGMAEAQADNKRTLVLTSTRALQTHYINIFRNLNPLEIKGKSNYSCRATELGGEFYDGSSAKSVADGPCQFGVECGLKAFGCKYYDDVRKAGYHRLVVSNYAAWISSNLYADGWGSKFELLICDEAHEAEKWITSVMSIKLPTAYESFTGRMPRSEDPDEWQAWAEVAYPLIKNRLQSSLESARNSRRISMKAKVHTSTLRSAAMLLERMLTITEEWLVYRDDNSVHFTPVWSRAYAEAYLFNKIPKVVLMSATMIQYELNLLGINKSRCDYFEYPSTFPAKNRPIYYYPVVRMRHDMDVEDALAWISVVDDFISKRLTLKGVIHTVSFARARALMACSRYSSLMVANSSSATAITTLQKFKAIQGPAILVTPSMGTGTDLPYCDYAIIPKVPFDNITDPLYNARSESDPTYGPFQAAKKLRQMVGRIVRSTEDYGETLITDAAFEMFRGKYKHMLPSDFWAAFQQVDILPDPMER